MEWLIVLLIMSMVVLFGLMFYVGWQEEMDYRARFEVLESERKKAIERIRSGE